MFTHLQKGIAIGGNKQKYDYAFLLE